jgi:putative DNA primase/helicase
MTADEGLGLALLAERFRWDASASARLLMGWIALAPIAGALEWRPHTWISGVSGSGKTTVVNMVVLPLLGDMALFALGNTTEAGLRQTLKSDSLPVVFDEAESNQRQDAQRMQNVLALARAASAETGAHQYKGSARGEAMMFEIRSMFMMSSINSALKEGADRSRFSSLLLRSAVGDDTERWEALERDIALACTKETGKRLIARMVQLVPLVRQVAVQMVRVVAMELKGGARMGQQVGTLLAGYWCLCNDQPPTEEEALALVRDVDWEEHGGSGDERGGDQGDLLATLLEARLTVESGTARHSLTVKELCLISSGTVTDMNLDPNAARMELGRNGMLAKGGRLYVAYRSKGIERILRDTPWAVGGWKNLLLAVTGADKHDPMRFPAVETTIRAVSVPLG